jgi:hypothetical protein
LPAELSVIAPALRPATLAFTVPAEAFTTPLIVSAPVVLLTAIAPPLPLPSAAPAVFNAPVVTVLPEAVI